MKNELLAKYIMDEADAGERQVVERWLRESEDHQREFRKLERRVMLGAKRYKTGMFDRRVAARKIKFPTNIYHSRVLRVAAVVIVVITGVWTWNRLQPEETVYVSKKGKMKVVILPDSTRVTLRGNSRLAYDSRFGTTSREISLKGKAYFKVSRDDAKPFVVNTDLIRVEVLGTWFQVVAHRSFAGVYVKRGRVMVTALDSDQIEILETGMDGIYDRDEGVWEITTQEDNTLYNEEAGIFEFDNATLSEVVETLNRYHGSHVRVPEEYASLRISVVFNGVTLEEAIEIINRTLDIRLSV